MRLAEIDGMVLGKIDRCGDCDGSGMGDRERKGVQHFRGIHGASMIPLAFEKLCKRQDERRRLTDLNDNILTLVGPLAVREVSDVVGGFRCTLLSFHSNGQKCRF